MLETQETLNDVLTREFAEDGYSGVEVRVNPRCIEIIILVTQTQNALGEKVESKNGGRFVSATAACPSLCRRSE